PFIGYDMVTLYFSSKGHKNMGGYDIFRSVYDPKEGKWSPAENLGYPINTPDDDIFYITSADGKRAYYSSVREDGLGYTDIYLITTPEGMKDQETEALAAEEVDPQMDPGPEPEPEPEPERVAAVEERKPLRFVVTVVDGKSQSPVSAKVGLQ